MHTGGEGGDRGEGLLWRREGGEGEGIDRWVCVGGSRGERGEEDGGVREEIERDREDEGVGLAGLGFGERWGRLGLGLGPAREVGRPRLLGSFSLSL